MKKTVKTSISLVYWSLAGVLRALTRIAGRAGSGRMIILYYHGISPDMRAAFARQMDLLIRHALPVRADYDGPLEAGRLHVAVTFDDGFKSVRDIALPELQKRGIPATIFVPGGMLGRHPAWKFDDANNDRTEIVMTGGELSQLPDGQVTIGSHSMTHPRMPELDAGALERELDQSRLALERIMSRPVDLFSFPYGAHDDRVLEACRKAGYKQVFTIKPVGVDPHNGGFVRGRVSVDPADGDLDFVLKMNGAYGWMPLATAIKSAVFPRRRRRPTGLASGAAGSSRPEPK